MVYLQHVRYLQFNFHWILEPIIFGQIRGQWAVLSLSDLVTTWHLQIARGTTWQPYKAKTLAKTAAFFSVKQPKFEFPALFSPEP